MTNFAPAQYNQISTDQGEKTPWPWNYDEEAKINPFFAQVWYPLHSKEGSHSYGPEIFDHFKAKVTK